MSSSSDTAVRGRVLRGGDASAARPARMDSELRSNPFAAAHVVDARLTDPHLQDVVASARAAAVEQGRAEGFAAGYAAGQAVAAAEAATAREATLQVERRAEQARDDRLAAALAVLTTAAEGFAARESLAVAEVEDTVVDLALQLARAVLDRELALSASPGREAVARALRLATPAVATVVRLHPDDLAVVGDVTDLAAGRAVTLVGDPGVEPGGCVVDGAGRQVDAQIGSALERVAAVLR